MNWDNKFSSRSLSRGYDYYLHNAVLSYQEEDDHIQAVVSGTYDYDVSIDFNHEGKIIRMDCSCPYHREQGENCKHMAAVLYLQEEKRVSLIKERKAFEKEGSLKERQDPKERVLSILAHLDTVTKDNYLLDIFLKNPQKLIKLKVDARMSLDSEDLDFYKQKIDTIIRQNSHNYTVSYYQAEHYFSDLSVFIDKDIKYLVDNNQSIVTLDLIAYLLKQNKDLEIEGYGDYSYTLVDTLRDYWTSMLALEENKKENLFHWLVLLNNQGIDVDHLIDDYDYGREINLTKKDIYEEKLKIYCNVSKEEKELDLSSLSCFLKFYLSYLEKFKEYRQRWEELSTKFYDLSNVRSYLVDYYLRHNNKEKALEIVQYSLIVDTQSTYSINSWNQRKKDILFSLGRKEEYIQVLYDLYANNGINGLAFYHELKNNYTTKEWKEEKGHLLSFLKDDAFIIDIYAEEGMADEVFAFVFQMPSLFNLDKYTPLLTKKYSIQLLGLYKDQLEEEAKTVSNTGHYNYLVSMLRKMLQIPNGKEVVKEIEEDWRIKYKRRRCMMEELNYLYTPRPEKSHWYY